MAASTGIIVAAGAFPLADLVLVQGWYPARGVLIVAGTVAAALVAAGMDKIVPGFGTGSAVVLLVASLLEYAPAISKALFPSVGAIGKSSRSVTV